MEEVKYTGEMMKAAFATIRAVASNEIAQQAIQGDLGVDFCLRTLMGWVTKDWKSSIIVRRESLQTSDAIKNFASIGAFTAGALYGQPLPPSMIVCFDWNKLVDTLVDTVFLPKNHDYGNAFEVCGVPGLMVRIGDKLQRIRAMSAAGKTYGETGKVRESMRDTVTDACVYSAIGVMLLRQQADSDG